MYENLRLEAVVLAKVEKTKKLASEQVLIKRSFLKLLDEM